MPFSPTKCIGMKVRLNPISISQKCTLPMLSLSIFPNILGNQ